MTLRIIGLTKYFEKKCIFKDFSYDFEGSGIYTLKGESGIGKTTLLRIIAGLDKDYSGVVEGGGIGRVGMAFQEYRLFPQLTALENVVFAISDKKNTAVLDNAHKMLSLLGFEERDIELLPDELSGGMKQRISLARAFLSGYPILLLDEPTKELDEVNATQVLNIIKELSKDRLIILVSHNVDDAKRIGATEILIDKLH